MAFRPVLMILAAAILLIVESSPAIGCVAASPGRISLDEGVTVAVVADVVGEDEASYHLRVVDGYVGTHREGEELLIDHGSRNCNLLSVAVGERVALLSVNPDGGLDRFGTAIWHVRRDGTFDRARVAAHVRDAIDPKTLDQFGRLLGLPDTTTADSGLRRSEVQARFLFTVLISLGILFASITMGRRSHA